MITGKALDDMVSRKADRAASVPFYKARDYVPVSVADGAVDARAKSAIAYLGDADDVGLDPADYPTDFESAITADALAEAELELTESGTRPAPCAVGRVHFSRVGADIQFTLVAPEPAEVLAKLASGDDAGKALDSYNPPQAEFKALRAKLAEVRNAPAAEAEEEGGSGGACGRRQDPAPG